MKMTKKLLSFLLCLALISSITANLGAGFLNTFARIDITDNVSGERVVPSVSIVVPEVIYLKPGTASFDRYLNGGVMPSTTSSATGRVRFDLLDGVTVDEGTWIDIHYSNIASLNWSTVTTATPNASAEITITSGEVVTGLQDSLITWEFLYTVDGVDYTAYAYTYVYAPFLGQAGAQIAVKRDGDQTLGVQIYSDYGVNSYGFVTGVHSVSGGNYLSNFSANVSKKTGSVRNTAPLYAHYTLGEWSGVSGYVPEGGDPDQGGASGWIMRGSDYEGLRSGIHTNTDYFIPQNGGGVRLRGYKAGGETNIVGDTDAATAYITVDKSRHTNLSQIPYLSAGVMQFYYVQCVELDLYGIESLDGAITTTGSVVTDDNINMHDGVAYGLYHLNGTVPEQSRNYVIEAVQKYRQEGDSSSYIKLRTNLQVNVVDKQSLRENLATWINKGLQASDYTSTKWSAYASALSAAARVLGDPTATAAQISSAVTGLNNAGTLLNSGRKQCAITVNHLLPANGSKLTVNGTDYTVTNGYAVIHETSTFYAGATIHVVPNAYEGYDPPAAPYNEYWFNANDTVQNLNVSFVYTPAVITPTFNAYDINKYSAYYYAPSSGNNYIYEMGLYYSKKSNADARDHLISSGYIPVGGNFNAGSEHTSKYVHLGVKYNSDPNTAATAFRVLTNGNTAQNPIYSSINSNTEVPFYKVGSGVSSLTPNVLDGVVDLNLDNGGSYLYLFATNAAKAGPPITEITMSYGKTSAEVINQLTGDGFTIATRFDDVSTYADLNLGSGGDYNYLGYKTNLPQTTTALKRLGSAYNYAADCFNNGGSYYSGLLSAMTTAATILDDYTSDSWSATYSEAQINAAAKAIMENLPAMSIGTQYAISSTASARRYFRFTPTESGSYIFFTSGTDNYIDPKIHILLADTTFGADLQYTNTTSAGYNIITYNDDVGSSPGGPGKILGISSYQAFTSVVLNANTTYYIDVFVGKAVSDLPFQVCKAVNISFNATGGSGSVTCPLPAGYETMNMNAGSIGVSRANHTLAGWSKLSNRRMLKTCLSSDKLAVPSTNTTYFALWNPDISGATPLTLNSGSDISADLTAKGQMVFYSYTPSVTGKYVIYSTSSTSEALAVDPFVIVWERDALDADPDNDLVYQDDCTSELRAALGGNTASISRNFALELDLTAGKEYIFGLKACHGTTGDNGNNNISGDNCGLGTFKFRFEKVYAVTYNINGGTSTTPSAQKKYYGRNLTLTSERPDRRGCVFAGWNTASAGSGVNYPAGGTYSGNYDVVLYANWEPITVCKVTLNNQSASTAGTTAYWYYYNTVYNNEYYYTDSACSIPLADITITVPTKTGYTFKGYYTATNGSGTQYIRADGRCINNLYNSCSQDVTLYAYWEPRQVTIHWDCLGGNINGQSFVTTYSVYGQSVTFPSAPPVRTGYVFDSWYDDLSDGNKITSSRIVNFTDETVFYASWTPITYTVNYNKNASDATGYTPPTLHTYNTMSTLATCGFTRPGYSFVSWNTMPNGNGTSYYGNGIVKYVNLSYTNGEEITLYAIWQANTYTLRFENNSEDAVYIGDNPGDDMPDMAVVFGEYFVMPGCDFDLDGYSFEGWALTPTGEVVYDAGEHYIDIAANGGEIVTLYAKWAPKQYVIVFNGNGNTSGSTPCQYVYFDATVTLNPNGFVKDGYNFIGWATSKANADNGIVEYTDCASFTLRTKGVTLYAVYGEPVRELRADGKYYIDGVPVPAYYGLIEYEGDFYYIKDNARIVRSTVCYVSKTNGLTFSDGTPIPTGSYEFDADGKLMIKQGVQADGRYYINGLSVPSYYGLVLWEGDFYYIKDNAQIVRSRTCYINTTHGLTLPNGAPIQNTYYEFDADGKMIIKQGIWSDDKYYIDGVAVPSYYGLVLWEGDFYYVKDNAKIVRSKTCQVNTLNGLTFPNGDPIKKGGYYEFDGDGKMIIKQGIWSDGKYYINGVAVGSYYGLVLWEGNFYYIKDNAQIVRSKVCQVNTLNGLTFPNGDPIKKGGYYEFDADGKMIVKQGIQSDGKYYINGVAVPSYYGLVLWEGDYYYIRDNAQIVRNKTIQVNTTNGLTFPDGTPIPRASFAFDADGKMIY